jgi:flavodoxin
MKVTVLYDSVFGNTEKVAQAIGAALSDQAEVDVRQVGDAPPEFWTGLDALIVGSPTRAFSPTPATKSLLAGIPREGLQGIRVAAFDTRAEVKEVGSRILSLMVRFFGYAAEPIAARLRRKGGQEALPPAGFFVEGTEGPLRAGELERAGEWARGILK